MATGLLCFEEGSAPWRLKCSVQSPVGLARTRSRVPLSGACFHSRTLALGILARLSGSHRVDKCQRIQYVNTNK